MENIHRENHRTTYRSIDSFHDDHYRLSSIVQLAWELRSSMLHASLGVYVDVVYIIAQQPLIHIVIVVIFIIDNRGTRRVSSRYHPFVNRIKDQLS